MSYSIFSGVTSGLQNAYSVLSTASSGNVTASSISSAMGNSKYAYSLMGNSFSSYIMSNFTTLDTNHDGTLSSTELSNLTNSIARSGLTASQLSQLGSASGLSNETLEQVLQHFSDIDADHDGKVTSAEINNFKLKSTMEEKKSEFTNKMATDESVFYGDEDSSAANSSSMVSFKYWNNGSSSSSSSGSSSTSSL